METSEAKEERSFGDRLRELRKQRSLSQSELGELTGLHFTNISRYERGLSHPGADRELLNQFKEVDRLFDDKKQFIKRVIDALLVKEKIRNLAV